jgi:antitoxin component of MazEF toxin-antitoxin module
MVSYRTVVTQTGNNTGFVIPDEVVEAFDAGKRVPVTVTVQGHSYASTIVRMGGRFMIPLAKEHREAAGVQGGDEVELTLVHDTAVRTVEVPDDLAAALADAGLRERFDALAFTHQKEHVRSVTEAKAAETRARRIQKVVDALS